MKRSLLFALLLSSFPVQAVFAADEFAALKARVAKELNGQLPTSIRQTSVEGLYEVIVPPRVFYMSKDGRYIVTGDYIDLEKRVNLSEGVRAVARQDALKSVGENSMIVFSPKQVKHTVTIFTDIDCTYCRKLHNEMKQYNNLGIKVRYMAFPRAGVGSPSYNKAVSVWCADDPQKAMTQAKNGNQIPAKSCDNPVEQHYKLGQMFGINGTPALLLEGGDIYPGYVPADRLLAILQQTTPGAKP